MAQFIPLTAVANNENLRVNVDQIVHYGSDGSNTPTEVFLSGGGILKVKEGISAIDDLIRNKAQSAILSPGS